MSYNITACEVLSIGAWMWRRDARALVAKASELGVCLPDENFLQTAADGPAPGGKVHLADFSWLGEWSGHSYDFLKNIVAPMVKGSAQVVFVWEGGDSQSGLWIADGKVSECDVKKSLEPRE